MKRPDVVLRNKSERQRQLLSDSWKDGRREASRAKIGKSNSIALRGRVLSVQHKENIRLGLNKAIKRPGVQKGNTPWNKGLTKEDPRIASYTKKSGESRKGKSGHWKGKKRPECREWILKTMASGKMKKVFNTKPELKMKELLNALGVHYVFQAHEGGYMMDFYIPSKKLNVEVDGEYWHNFPNGREKDRVRDRDLESKGYKVIRFWARDVFSMTAISL